MLWRKCCFPYLVEREEFKLWRVPHPFSADHHGTHDTYRLVGEIAPQDSAGNLILPGIEPGPDSVKEIIDVRWFARFISW